MIVLYHWDLDPVVFDVPIIGHVCHDTRWWYRDFQVWWGG